MAFSKLDFEKALADPRSVYHWPEAVVADPRLDRRAKLQILRRWEENERALEVAEDEAMTGGETSILRNILRAIASLDGTASAPKRAPTKQGGGANSSDRN